MVPTASDEETAIELQLVHINIHNKNVQADSVSRILNDYPDADVFIFSEANYKCENEDDKPLQKSVGSFKNMILGMDEFI